MDSSHYPSNFGYSIAGIDENIKTFIKISANGVMISYGYASMEILKCAPMLQMMIAAGSVNCLR